MYWVYVQILVLVTFFVLPSSLNAQKDTIYYDFTFDINDWVEFLNDTIQDIHGNKYGTLKLGDQIWMDRNLRVTKFRDGSEIQKVKKETDWMNEDQPFYTYGPQHVPTIYYNYSVAESNEVCPTGWRVPSSTDWKILLHHFKKMNDEYMVLYYDSSNVDTFPLKDSVGIKIRESDSTVVIIKNADRPVYNENALFFTESLDGYINDSGQQNFSSWAYWWCADSSNHVNSWYGAIDRPFGPEQLNMSDDLSNKINPEYFLSIRCIKDNN